MSDRCTVLGCSEAVSKAGHRYCYRHWQLDKARGVQQDAAGTWREAAEPNDEPDAGERLSSTKLGKHFDISPTRMNLILAELGWIEKYTKGWVPTERGNHVGAEVREARQSGVPYVVWPPRIRDNSVLKAAVAESVGGEGDRATAAEPPKPAVSAEVSDFRERFPAKFRATDGHLVRSRAEMLIDNWLYMQEIVHAVERKLPIEEEVYCDFYLPAGKVYIEYWGLEKEPKYAARKAEKIGIYNRYGLNLVQLSDDHIMSLDDVLASAKRTAGSAGSTRARSS